MASIRLLEDRAQKGAFHRAVFEVTVYTAEPGTPNDEGVTPLAGRGAMTRPEVAPTSHD